jgi:hypothetical protein
MVVRLPARLALMTAEIDPQQMIQVEGKISARRDIALWWRAEDSERPDSQKVREFIRAWVMGLDKTVGEFELGL